MPDTCERELIFRVTGMAVEQLRQIVTVDDRRWIERLGVVVLGLALVVALGGCGSNGGGDDAGGGDGDAGGMDTAMDTVDADGSEFTAFDDSCTTTTGPGADAEETTNNLLEAFVGAESGSVICMVEGDYMVTQELSVNPNNVTLLGESQEGTVLDFDEQEQGANGILAQVEENFAARNFTIKNTDGDAIKAKGTDGVVFKNLTVTWDAGVSEENGAYALYPVEAKNVLIEGCSVSYARDAGVYLGQSETAIIRDNEAFGNVVGIEVENTFHAEVYGNEAYENTDGFLIINLPDLEVKGGSGHLVYDNEIYENNTENFGEPGTAVANMPQGTGLVVVTTNDSEIRDNVVRDNQSIGIGVVTYRLIEDNIDDDDYDPYPEGNWVHDNTVENNGTDPQGAAQVLGNPVPQVFWDGKYDDSRDNDDGSLTNCFGDNQTPEGEPVEMQRPDSTSDCPDDETVSFCENDCSHSPVEEVELPDRVIEMAE